MYMIFYIFIFSGLSSTDSLHFNTKDKMHKKDKIDVDDCIRGEQNTNYPKRLEGWSYPVKSPQSPKHENLVTKEADERDLIRN